MGSACSSPTKWTTSRLPRWCSTGSPQIEFNPEFAHWHPRGDVLRCVITDPGLKAHFQIDDRILTIEEFGEMMVVYSGWGVRMVIVPEDELHLQPEIEVREPDMKP